MLAAKKAELEAVCQKAFGLFRGMSDWEFSAVQDCLREIHRGANVHGESEEATAGKMVGKMSGEDPAGWNKMVKDVLDVFFCKVQNEPQEDVCSAFDRVNDAVTVLWCVQGAVEHLEGELMRPGGGHVGYGLFCTLGDLERRLNGLYQLIRRDYVSKEEKAEEADLPFSSEIPQEQAQRLRENAKRSLFHTEAIERGLRSKAEADAPSVPASV
ncbi:MAG: hypothetical protein DRP97_02950 [Candidatus Latescibacterota bacterium]|nr:MAG: hypothetical protein DRP97_02950 [Candidatus Latescibacterota bacterium]